MKIVAGGTKTLLQLVEVAGGSRTVIEERRFESGGFPTFDALLRELLSKERGPIDAGCFAVAGPVLEGRAEVTNLGWLMESEALAAAFGIGKVALINDFYAVALGVPLLAPGDILSLHPGKRVAHGPIAILGAGTGLGEAALIHDGAKWDVVATEGGHADFAPQDDQQSRLFLYLHERYGHVSWERVLSGMGLVNIHNFLTGQWREYDERIPVQLADAAAAGEATAVETFRIFVDLYGAEAGNMALHFLARGGVYLAGGIAGKHVPLFTDGRFAAAFARKGRFERLLAEIPVDLITNAKVGLLGAVEMAVRIAGG
jgi:glucokinase